VSVWVSGGGGAGFVGAGRAEADLSE
jgi:hypothetical protein